MCKPNIGCCLASNGAKQLPKRGKNIQNFIYVVTKIGYFILKKWYFRRMRRNFLVIVWSISLKFAIVSGLTLFNRISLIQQSRNHVILVIFKCCDPGAYPFCHLVWIWLQKCWFSANKEPLLLLAQGKLFSWKAKGG